MVDLKTIIARQKKKRLLSTYIHTWHTGAIRTASEPSSRRRFVSARSAPAADAMPAANGAAAGPTGPKVSPFARTRRQWKKRSSARPNGSPGPCAKLSDLGLRIVADCVAAVGSFEADFVEINPAASTEFDPKCSFLVGSLKHFLFSFLIHFYFKQSKKNKVINF